MKLNAKRRNAAVILPVFLQFQITPWTGLLTNVRTIQRGGSVPPARHKKRWEHRFDLRARTLPRKRFDPAVRISIASLAIRNPAFRMSIEPSDLDLEFLW